MKESYNIEKPEGKICWQVLQKGMKKRCYFCPVPKLLEKNEILNFTVSMGLSCRENLNNIDKILQKSDELLYEAKKSGRNRLIRFNR